MRVIFFGTPELSVPTLEMLVEAGHEVVLVVTQADKRRSRGARVLPSPVKAAAERLNLNVSHRVKDTLAVKADIGVLVAFGRIIKDEILDNLNIINLHPSLLPRWRGATPVEAAILAGDSHTGICAMALQSEMDAGPVYARYETAIGPVEKAEALYERLFKAGNSILRELLEQEQLPTPVPQTGEPTFCGKITTEDLRIDWHKSAEEVLRLSRVGRAWTTFRSKRFLILSAISADDNGGEPGLINETVVGAGHGAIRLVTVQPEGKGPIDASAWANGARLVKGEKLGLVP